jgi:hypothetical protein
MEHKKHQWLEELDEVTAQFCDSLAPYPLIS